MHKGTYLWQLALLTAAVLGGFTACSTARGPAAVQTRETQLQLTPADALQRLQDGNQRFVQGRPLRRPLLRQVRETASGQYPSAVILSCVDSRVPPEIVFDQGFGDVFVARLAGNVLNEDVLGSVEFATAVAGARLILVLGHTSCGAVKGAIDGVELGYLTPLLEKIRPAVEAEARPGVFRTSKDSELVDAVAVRHVLLTLQAIREESPVVRDLIDRGQLALTGAIYDLESGHVTFLE
jgi:carbonic anhydrase